jgi:hypothetical protein
MQGTVLGNARGASSPIKDSGSKGAATDGAESNHNDAVTAGSNSMEEPWYGSGHPGMALEHRLTWSQAAVTALGTVSARRQQVAHQLEQGGENGSAVQQRLQHCELTPGTLLTTLTTADVAACSVSSAVHVTALKKRDAQCPATSFQTCVSLHGELPAALHMVADKQRPVCHVSLATC